MNENGAVRTKRDAILDAAGQVVCEHGAGAMTLDAVARYAGVSKGGLLYHFSSKEALAHAMVERLIADFEAALNAEIAREIREEKAPARGQWLRAYVRVNTVPGDTSDVVAASLLAAFGESPHLLEPVQAAFARWQTKAEQDGVPVPLATSVRLAADGFWLCALFGIRAGTQDEAELSALRQMLIALVDDALEDSETK